MVSYIDLADSLAAEISRGERRPGERLPTHRELAWKLGRSVGTVTRAYRELERRGLVRGEVGRGTFVTDPDGDARQPASDTIFPAEVLGRAAPREIDMSLNYIRHPSGEELVRWALAAVVQTPPGARSEIYRDSRGDDALILIAQGAVFAGVRVDPGDGQPRLRDAEVPLQRHGGNLRCSDDGRRR